MQKDIIKNKFNKFIEDNNKLILIIGNKLEFDELKEKNIFFSLLKKELQLFINPLDFKFYKKITIDNSKYKNDIIKYFKGIDTFPLIIVFEYQKPKYIIPLDFEPTTKDDE